MPLAAPADPVPRAWFTEARPLAPLANGARPTRASGHRLRRRLPANRSGGASFRAFAEFGPARSYGWRGRLIGFHLTLASDSTRTPSSEGSREFCSVQITPAPSGTAAFKE